MATVVITHRSTPVKDSGAETVPLRWGTQATTRTDALVFRVEESRNPPSAWTCSGCSGSDGERGLQLVVERVVVARSRAWRSVQLPEDC